ncbi:hypothetical protein VK792_05630 [Mesobacterium sp. TK19101]|uniref:Lipoprotein n=1 Tax=Mesobacterium hydrothermale TaxID=3111907 RepID=A0ABU6HF62_9RHOB|nr:hypothetical protein [Mesobacterium sp. TK19101]MEC3860757.1 hypothetical protein [Mesobacterium sp. TK19101]
MQTVLTATALVLFATAGSACMTMDLPTLTYPDTAPASVSQDCTGLLKTCK